MTLDSSIPSHLRCPRTRTRQVSDKWVPPVPAFSSRPDPSIENIVMSYFGVQVEGEEKKDQALAALQNIVASFKEQNGPARYDLVRFIDAQGYFNAIAVGYWLDTDTFHKWNESPAIANWWASDKRLTEGVGYFREILRPRMEQFETIFTHKHGPFEGVSVLFGEMSEPIIEHGYWGSMRDRLPLSQTSTMDPEGELSLSSGSPALGGRVIINGHDNLTLIRSGEDWSTTEGEERRTWYEEIEPVLHEGMNYLRDDGLEVGCYCNRYLHHMDENGNKTERGFGYSLWRSVSVLETWGATHQTHLQIFVTFNRLAKKFKNLTLYHEVSVFDGANQYYEYINCHPQTGLMRAI
ncbi:phenylacetaldoxime dehydratase family protein [Hyphomicrobium sp. MC1]|uniref:phenylacetaldoxime dehydratase family protein n=1 Tax=Hyphomicrobium sp. (strain MC1) TaxID=717785 RepID=UPI000213F774|nr:phenylacetaldoxime dehydratase family protein [Hyphomicrobium sp. MC1]CCB63713.1 putative aldoxime dehydratase [Hyphomicrobium sp. MC1]